MAYFPLVGAILGAILMGLDVVLSKILPEIVVASLVLLTSVALTGGLHMDGLADSADGLFGGRSRERALEIMKDSRLGSFGAMAILGLYLVKFSSLIASPPPVRWVSLLLAPALGRCVMVWGAFLYPYAREEGLGKAYTEYVGRTEVILASLTCILIGLGWMALTGASGVSIGALLGTGFIITLLAARFISVRIGGMTGDTFGALNEVAETLVFFLTPLYLGGLCEVRCQCDGRFSLQLRHS